MRTGMMRPNSYEILQLGPQFLVSLDVEVRARTSEDALDLALEEVRRGNFTIRLIQLKEVR